ncbi:hypothetical protein FJ492_22635 [Mesorhizobium sp. B2-5-4]|nr:hypothetical protein FJ492_22635 [Mesorhizobium sp. B2-5-4]
MLDSPEETGAGEAIRTLDPNLGKREITPSKGFTVVCSIPSQCAPERDPCSFHFQLGTTPMDSGEFQCTPETVTAR